MNGKTYNQKLEDASRDLEIYRLRIIEGFTVSEIIEKLGVTNYCAYHALSTFEGENPQMAELMKRQGKETTENDYKALQKEIASLKADLTRERLRADFYEEMVAFGKEVYGIDLKKVGTK